MSVRIGIVIGADNPAYEGYAQVRIPAIHGIPLTKTPYHKMEDKYNKYVGKTITASGSNQSILEEFALKNLDNAENTKVVSDEGVPWYPIIYPFGSNMGPHINDLVYVLDESYVVGWANRPYDPYDV
jgi:hypothetical protein